MYESMGINQKKEYHIEIQKNKDHQLGSSYYGMVVATQDGLIMQKQKPALTSFFLHHINLFYFVCVCMWLCFRLNP